MIEFIQNDERDSDSLVKKRHVLLTLYLALLSFSALAGMGLYFTAIITGKDPISEALSISPPLFLSPAWFTCVMILTCIVSLVAIVGIIKWRKWGGWLYICNALVSCGFWTIYDQNYIENTIFSILEISIFYGLLSIGGKNKAWPQLD